uniref:Uncharacterized protein n=1 Tax=Aegilops tauschii subsp. strangulata TaxID=200361 RepID=A0A453DVF0_AEGTS
METLELRVLISGCWVCLLIVCCHASTEQFSCDDTFLIVLFGILKYGLPWEIADIGSMLLHLNCFYVCTLILILVTMFSFFWLLTCVFCRHSPSRDPGSV